MKFCKKNLQLGVFFVSENADMELNCKVLGVVKWGAAWLSGVRRGYVGCGVSKQGAACPGEMRRGQVRNRLMFTAAPSSKSRPAHRLWTSPGAGNRQCCFYPHSTVLTRGPSD